MPTVPDALVERLLRTWPVARLATCGPDGRPHMVPIVFVWHDGLLWTPVDGKPKRGGELARVRNLRRDPRATLLLDRYAADWSLLWWIRLDGRATACAVTEAAGADAARALREKYPQYDRWPLFRDDPTLIRFEPQRRASWCAREDALDESLG